MKLVDEDRMHDNNKSQKLRWHQNWGFRHVIINYFRHKWIYTDGTLTEETSGKEVVYILKELDIGKELDIKLLSHRHIF